MKPFTTIAAFVFLVMAIFHLLRLTSRWDILVNDFLVPQWVSIPGFFIAAALSLLLWHEARKK